MALRLKYHRETCSKSTVPYKKSILFKVNNKLIRTPPEFFIVTFEQISLFSASTPDVENDMAVW